MGISLDPPGLSPAVADSKYATRGDAYRAVTMREPSLVQVAHPSPPTVFTYPQASNPITSPVSYYPQSGQYELLGAVPLVTTAGATYPTTNVINGQTSDAAKMAWGPGFVHFGKQVAIRWRSAVVGAYQYIVVDGRPISLEPTLPVDSTGAALTITANSYYVTVLTWPTEDRYEIEFYGRRMGIRDVMTTVTGSISPLNKKRLKVACVTASFGAGGPGVSSELDGWPWRFGRQLGVEVAQASIAGSGLIASVPFIDSARLAALVSWRPDAIAIELAGNDLDVGTAAEIAAALTTYLAALDTQLPGVPVVVFGMPPRNASFSSNALLKAASPVVSAAALAAPNVIGYHDYVGTDSTVTAYTTGANYAVGAKVIYLGSVYLCLTAVTSAVAVLDTAYWAPFSHYTGTGVGGGRTFADGVTSSTTTVTSATAAFTTDDVGASITGSGIPAGATVTARASATSITISAAATATATAVSLTLSKLKADGNRDVLVHYDSTHPTVLGQKGLALMYARDFRADLVNLG